jgi:hypothetical protein
VGERPESRQASVVPDDEGDVSVVSIRSVRMEYQKHGGLTLDELFGLARDAGFDASHVQDRDRFGIAWLQRSADSLSSARP